MQRVTEVTAVVNGRVVKMPSDSEKPPLKAVGPPKNLLDAMKPQQPFTVTEAQWVAINTEVRNLKAICQRLEHQSHSQEIHRGDSHQGLPKRLRSETTENQSDSRIVMFTADWCGPCKQIKPFFADLAERYKDRIQVEYVNMDEHPGRAAELNVTSVPTFVAYRGGQVIDQVQGANRQGINLLFGVLANSEGDILKAGDI